MAIVTTNTTVGNNEDLVTKIYKVAPEETAFSAAIGKTTATGTNHEWQTSTNRSANGSNAAVEGQEAAYVAQVATQRLGNYTQIFTTAFQVSDTQNAVKRTSGDEMSRLKVDNMLAMKLDVEAAALLNTTAVAGDGATVGRQMKGAAGWIQTNKVDHTSTPTVFVEQDVKDVLLAINQAGGSADQIHMSPHHKQIFSTFTGNVQRQQDVSGGAKQTLSTAFAIYESDFGLHSLIPNRVMTGATQILAVSTKNFKLATLRPFKATEMAKTGDSTKILIVYEATLEAGNEKSSGKIIGLQA